MMQNCWVVTLLVNPLFVFAALVVGLLFYTREAFEVEAVFESHPECNSGVPAKTCDYARGMPS
jgi:hypothetical protein